MAYTVRLTDTFGHNLDKQFVLIISYINISLAADASSIKKLHAVFILLYLGPRAAVPRPIFISL